jgi:hypothetical protein
VEESAGPNRQTLDFPEAPQGFVVHAGRIEEQELRLRQQRGKRWEQIVAQPLDAISFGAHGTVSGVTG